MTPPFSGEGQQLVIAQPDQEFDRPDGDRCRYSPGLPDRQLGSSRDSTFWG